MIFVHCSATADDQAPIAEQRPPPIQSASRRDCFWVADFVPAKSPPLFPASGFVDLASKTVNYSMKTTEQLIAAFVNEAFYLLQ